MHINNTPKQLYCKTNVSLENKYNSTNNLNRLLR